MSEKDWLIKGGLVIDPTSGKMEILDILIEDGKIKAIEKSLKVEKIPQINAYGLWVSPGLIDIHVHFRDPGYEYKETIETGLAAAAKGGFTQVCCMANTKPVNDTGAITRYMKEKAENLQGVILHPIGAITKGNQGQTLAEIGDMVENGAIGISDDGNPVMNSEVMRRAMEYSKYFDIPVIDHCEEKNLSRGGVMHEGEVSTRLGLKGIPSASEEIMVARDILLASYTKAKLHIQHVSSKGSIELIKWAKEKGISVTAEVTPHHLTLTDKAVEGYDTNTKVNPPLRGEEDKEALIEALSDGIIDCIASDHAPHSLKEKDVEYDQAAFGISGIETALSFVLKLVHEGRLSPLRAIEALTISPAKVMGIDGGKLQPGYDANITIIDPEKVWRIEPDKFASKGKNTPFKGWEVKGKAVCTMVKGKILYSEI